MRIIAFIAAATATFGSLALPAQADETLNLFVNSIRPAVISIRVTRTVKNGLKSDRAAGTGFFITSQGYLLTAEHVVKTEDDDEGVTVQYWTTVGDDTDRIVLEVIKRDYEHDLALLKATKRQTYMKLDLVDSDKMQRFEKILAVGYPQGSDGLLPAIGDLVQLSPNGERWIADIPVNPGHSGGPVLRRDGRVVGVVRGAVGGGVLMNVLTPIGMAKTLVANASLSVATATATPAPSAEVPARERFDDIPQKGQCEDHLARFSSVADGTKWVCVSIQVPKGGSPNVERTRDVVVKLPASAEVFDVRYFHRSRGDWHNPEEFGPWHANSPGADLQWMSMDKAVLVRTLENMIVSSTCRNWSHNLTMSCAIGIQYVQGKFLW